MSGVNPGLRRFVSGPGTPGLCPDLGPDLRVPAAGGVSFHSHPPPQAMLPMEIPDEHITAWPAGWEGLDGVGFLYHSRAVDACSVGIVKKAMKTRFIPILIALMGIGLCGLSVADAVPKSDPCPIGYLTQGHYCVSPPDNGTVAVTKVGDCPIGYLTQGSYCVATQEDRPRTSIQDGHCPVGFMSQGRFCVEGSKMP
jgi:hypothetical protein